MSIVVGSVAVEVVPSARGFRQKLAADLRDIKVTAQVQVDDGVARAELDTLTRDRHTEVKVDVDTSSVDKVNRSLTGTTSRIGAIVTAAAALGPALVPVAAGLTAAFTGLAAPLVAATAGIGAFAVFAVPAITSVISASQDLAKAQDAVDNALTSASRKTALARQKQLMADLSPATLAAVQSLHAFTETYKRFADALAPQVFAVFNEGLKVATAALPLLASLAASVAPALITLGRVLTDALSSPAMTRFVAFLSAQAGPVIISFGLILVNLAEGFGKLLVAFAPVGTTLLAGLLSMSQAFAVMADSKGFKSFLAYAVANLPLVGRFLGDVVHGVGAILVAFAPFGPVVLKILDALVRGITLLATNAPGAAVAIGLIAVALLAIGGPVGVVVAAIIAIGTAFKYVYDHSAPLRAVLGHYLDLAKQLGQAVLPVLARVAKSVGDAIHDGIGKISRAIAENRPAIDQFLGQLKTIAQFIYTQVLPVLGVLLVTAIRLFVAAIVGAITVIHLFETVVNRTVAIVKAIVSAVRSVVSGIAGVFTAVGTAISAASSAVIGLVKRMWADITAGFRAGVAFVRAVWQGFWSSSFGKLVSAALGLVVAIVRFNLAVIRAAFSAAGSAISAVVSAVFGRVRAIVTSVMNAIAPVVAAVWRRISSVVSASVTAVLSAVTRVRAVAGIIGGAFSAAYTAVSGAIGRIVGLAASIGGRIRSAVGNLGGILVSAGRSVITGLISGISSGIGALTSKLHSITSMIPKVKGPANVDRMLLHGSGQLIMQGLIAGIGSQVPALTSQLRAVTAGISVAGSPTAPRLAVTPHAYGAARGGITVNVNGALDPKAVGRQLEQVLLHWQRTGKGGAPLAFSTS